MGAALLQAAAGRAFLGPQASRASLPPPGRWLRVQGLCCVAVGQSPLWVGCSEPDLVFVLLMSCVLCNQSFPPCVFLSPCLALPSLDKSREREDFGDQPLCYKARVQWTLDLAAPNSCWQAPPALSLLPRGSQVVTRHPVQASVPSQGVDAH